MFHARPHRAEPKLTMPDRVEPSPGTEPCAATALHPPWARPGSALGPVKADRRMLQTSALPCEVTARQTRVSDRMCETGPSGAVLSDKPVKTGQSRPMPVRRYDQVLARQSPADRNRTGRILQPGQINKTACSRPVEPHQGRQAGSVSRASAGRLAFACETMAPKASLSAIARSASIFRSTSIPATFRPCIMRL